MHLGQHSQAVIIAANEERVHTTYKLVLAVTQNNLYKLLTIVIYRLIPSIADHHLDIPPLPLVE